MKKIIALALALMMVLSLAVTASADEATPATYSITINNAKTGHTYEAYQIFTGDLVTDENNQLVLSDVVWGDGITAAGQSKLGDAATIAESLKVEADAIAFSKNVALYLGTMAGYDDTPEGGKYVIDVEEPGYYLVKDADDSLNGQNDVYTRYIIKVVGEAVANPKSSAPSVQKKVDDENDTVADDPNTPNVDEGEDGKAWNDSADHDIGDNVPFQLKATLGNTVSDYLKYKVVFRDTLSEGLTYDAGSYKVYLDSVAEEYEVTEHFVAVYDETSGKLSFTCENVKDFGATDNSVIIVEYTATLNEKANIGAEGNPNYVYLEYSNNPNWAWEKWGDTDGDGDIDEEDDKTPEIPKNPGDDGKDNDDDGKTDEDDEDVFDEPTGKTPEDKVIVFTYKVGVDKVDENLVALPGAAFELHKQQEDGSWKKIDLTVDADGTNFSSVGLDDGFYRITETKAPAGYNSVDPIYFLVEATHSEEADAPVLESLTVTVTDADGEPIADANADPETGKLGDFNVVLEDGAISTKVVNQAGTVLPETGGMGTTLFYTVGGLLVAAAVVLLITKKRMSANA